MNHKISFILTLFLFFVKLAYTNNLQDILNNKNQFQQVESLLSYSLNYGKDTSALKKNLEPVLAYAKKQQNIPLQWAYYIRMADGFSIAFDNTNPTSDYYYQLAHQILAGQNQKEFEMITHIRQGYYNYVYRKVVKAFPYFLRADNLASSIDLKKTPALIQHYQFASIFFRYIGDFQKALEYLEIALPYLQTASRAEINHLNTIGIVHEDLKNKPMAIANYNKAIRVAEAIKDSVWIGILYGNLSKFEWEKGNKSKAIELLKKNIELSTRFNEDHDAMRSHIKAGNYYIEMQQWEQANYHIASSIKLMQDKPYYLQFKMDAAYALSKIAKGLNKTQQEAIHLNNYILLRDSLSIINDTKEIQRVIWKTEKNLFNEGIQKAEEKRKETQRLFVIIGIVAVLAFVVIILLINKSRTRIKMKNASLEKDQLKISYENKLLDQEMQLLQQSLDEFTTTIKHNNETIQQLKRDILNENSDNSMSKVELEQLNNLLESHIMTEERWIKFKFVFNKVNPNYLDSFKEQYPKITENDLKLVALQKLDLSNQVMSDLLCISVEGIKKAKQRLKKKME